MALELVARSESSQIADALLFGEAVLLSKYLLAVRRWMFGTDA